MSKARILLTFAAVVGCSGAAGAERLDKEACDGLRGEQSRLVAAGARRDMDRGPDWAKTNLAPDRLSNIRNLMGVEEQLIFRCDSLRPQPQQTETETAAPPAPPPKRKLRADRAKDGAPTGEPKSPKPSPAAGRAEEADAAKPARKSRKPPTTSDTASTSDGESAAAPPPKSAKSVPKPNDAFVPPATKTGSAAEKN